MGGRNFGSDAADRPALQQVDLPPASRSGLRLELSGRDSFSHGEPVVTEIKLSLDGSTPQPDAFPNLSPRGDHLTILVTDPAGAIRPFRPIASSCGSPDRRLTLDADTPALYDSAYLGYGADGLTFPTPGTYRLRALCKAPDGSTVTSPEHTIEVSPPSSEDDRRAGDLLMGPQQGTLLALLGSDAPQLADGNAALDDQSAVLAGQSGAGQALQRIEDGVEPDDGGVAAGEQAAGAGAGDLFGSGDDDVGEGQVDDALLAGVPGDGERGIGADAGGRVQEELGRVVSCVVTPCDTQNPKHV